MTCKDCLHFDACDISAVYFGGDIGSKNFREYEKRKNVELDCDTFKDKSRFIEVDENYYTHICKARGLIDEFSIFARVVDQTENAVTIERYQKFGALKIGNITISKHDFERYYKPIKEAE